VLALRPELDHVGRRAVDRLLPAQARPRVRLRPARHLLDEVEVVVAEVRPHEALAPRPGGDLPHALELREVEPLVRRAALVVEGEEARPLHLRRGEEEDDRLALVAGKAPLVDLELAHALAAPFVDDGELHALVTVVPVLGPVLERLPPVEDLARRLPAREGRRDERDGGEQEAGTQRHPGRPYQRPGPGRKERAHARRRSASSPDRGVTAACPVPWSQARPRYMYSSPANAVTAPVTTNTTGISLAGRRSGHVSVVSTSVTEQSWKNVDAFPLALGRTAIGCCVMTKRRK